MLHVCILSSRGILGQSWSVPVGCLSGCAACGGGVGVLIPTNLSKQQYLICNGTCSPKLFGGVWLCVH